MAKEKLNKVIKGLKKASKTHAQQAKTLSSIEMKKGGSAKKDNIPDNVVNPSLYRKAKAKAKAKFSVFPSAYASSYIVSQYKKMGGKYRGAKKAEGGEVSLKPIPEGNKGLPKLPQKVRNKMGFMAKGGSVEVQARGCGAVMSNKLKKTRVPRS
tara:strand:+ start:60 stop:521 length:462 start_codon:yes stop_codon:yes gene_type:complete